MSKSTDQNGQKGPVNIGAIYTNSTDPRYADERTYGSTFDGKSPGSKNLEKNLGANFVVLDYHDPAIEAIIKGSKTEKEALHKLKAYVRQFCIDNNIHGFASPGNDYNIIPPGKNKDNDNRALVERAVISVTRDLLIPFEAICGGEQRVGWEAIKKSLKAEIRDNFILSHGGTVAELKARQDITAEQMRSEFKKTFEAPFINRYKQLIDHFHTEVKRNSAPFNLQNIADAIKTFSPEKRDYLGHFFRTYFEGCIKEVQMCVSDQAKQAKMVELFGSHTSITPNSNTEHFKKYFATNEPGTEKIPSGMKADFRTMFNNFYTNYAEENGIIIINHSHLLTGHDHNPPGEGHKHIDKHAMIFVGQGTPSEHLSGYGEVAYAASEHNQALVNSDFVRSQLSRAGIDISYVGSAEKIVKAIVGVSEQWLKAPQFHPEQITVSDTELKGLIGELNRTPRNSDTYRELSGIVSANLFMREFGEAAHKHQEKYPDFKIPQKSFADMIAPKRSQEQLMSCSAVARISQQTAGITPTAPGICN